MAERRPLVQGLKSEAAPERAAEEEFIYGKKPKPPAAADLVDARKVTPIHRVPFTTRMREEFARALKRASLERQLEGIEPCQVQDILESALEPWLRANGYLN